MCAHQEIAPHCAPTNSRLTAHLGLLVPPPSAGSCFLRVGGDPPRRWEVGRCLLFDDSFEHAVTNATALWRAVLLVRFWHPDIASPEARQASERLSDERLAACLRRRTFPPLGASLRKGRLLERCVSGLAQCPACGVTCGGAASGGASGEPGTVASGGVGWCLHFEAPLDKAAGGALVPVGTCACGARLS